MINKVAFQMEYEIIPSEDQEEIKKRNHNFFVNLSAFKNDYIISSILRTYPEGLFRKHKDIEIYYIFNKDTSIIKVTYNDNEEIEPIQVFDVKDHSTCNGMYFIHMFSNIDVKAVMKQIDIDLGEKDE